MTLKEFTKQACNNWLSTVTFVVFFVYYILILINLFMPRFHFLEHEINLLYYLTKHPFFLFIYMIIKATISSYVVSKIVSLVMESLKNYFWTIFLTLWIISIIAQHIGIYFLLKSHFRLLYHAPPIIFH